MFNYVYKTTNMLDGKFYIGAHRTSNVDDGYMGSGTYLKRAIKKHGVENFNKEILAWFDSEKEMFEYETNLITEELLNNSLCYNLANGGLGGSIVQNRKPFMGPHTDEAKKRISAAGSGRKRTPEVQIKMIERNWARIDPEAQREHAKYAASCRKNWGPWSDATKQKVADSLKKRYAELGHPLAGVPKTQVECPHCNKFIAVNTAKRWHFDNCKQII